MSLIEDIKNKWTTALGGNVSQEEAVALEEESKADVTPTATEVSVDPMAPTQTAIEAEVEGEANPFSTGVYQRLARLQNQAIAPETPEEQLAREKRERSRNTIFNISDGLAHIANIWGTAGGAQAMDISSTSDAHRKSMDYAKQVRDRNREVWNRANMEGTMADREELRYKERTAKEERAWNRQIEQDNITNKRNAEADARANANLKLHEDAAAYNIKITDKKMDLAEKESKSKLANDFARTNAYVAKTLGGKTVNFKTKPFYLERKKKKLGGKEFYEGIIAEVPEELNDSFVTNVFNHLADLADVQEQERRTKTGEKIVRKNRIREAFDNYIRGTNEPSANVMKQVILLHAKDLGAEQYILDKANQYMDDYLRNLARNDKPGLPGNSSVTETPISDSLTDQEDWELNNMGITIE